MRYWLLAIGVALLLAGCGQSGTTATTQQVVVDGLTIALDTPTAPAVLEEAAFRITLTDSAGTPVEGAEVDLEMTMTKMPMGSNRPIATPAGPGVYSATGVFDMAGPWKLTVHATVNGKEHVATFDTAVAEPAATTTVK